MEIAGGGGYLDIGYNCRGLVILYAIEFSLFYLLQPLNAILVEFEASHIVHFFFISSLEQTAADSNVIFDNQALGEKGKQDTCPKKPQKVEEL